MTQRTRSGICRRALFSLQELKRDASEAPISPIQDRVTADHRDAPCVRNVLNKPVLRLPGGGIDLNTIDAGRRSQRRLVRLTF